MPQVSKFLRAWTSQAGRHGFTWWCPGCKHAHSIATDGGASPVWRFDGNLESPTFMPSFREFIPPMPDHPLERYHAEQTMCHVWIKDGQIDFLADCAHELRGLHPMVDLSTIKDYGWGYD